MWYTYDVPDTGVRKMLSITIFLSSVGKKFFEPRPIQVGGPDSIIIQLV